MDLRTRMLRPFLTLMLVSSMLSTSLLAGGLTGPTLKLVTPHSPAVSPNETFQFECELSEPSNVSVKFNLYRDGSEFRDKNAGNATTFNVAENTLGQFRYSCDYYQGRSSDKSNTINITVVNLLEPNISFSASGDWFHWWLQEREVTRGYSFSINCSTQPQYPGGFFHLRFNSGSSTTKITKSAVNHSATFVFNKAEYVDQGNYSCEYEVTVSSRTFRSPMTKSLAITVKESLVPFISIAAAAGLLFVTIPIIIFCIRKRQKNHSNSYGVNTLEENERPEIDEDDYENAAMALQQRNDSDESGEDYVDIDDELEKKRVSNNKKFAGAKNTNQINCTRNDSEDEDDDYENTEKEGLFDSDDDYINVVAEVEETEIQCIEAKNTNKTTCLRKNTETTGPEKEDSDDTDDDYINVDETDAQNQCADAKYTQESTHEESDMDDDDYEDPDANIQQIEDSDFSDGDYINVN